jgi:NAD(P)-dependent dehydrogenase (short-subunit alcohol dehydrogenase family)
LKLSERGIVVTGASRGFGRAVAASCLSEGAHVVICGRDLEALDQASAELRGTTHGDRVHPFVGDVSQPDQVSRLIEFARERLPRVYGLVNSAGVYGPMGLVEEIDWGAWVQAVEINLMGTVLPCRAVLPLFRAQGYGKIVNLSGGGATAPLPRLSAYAAGKAAVVRFTETLAEETQGSGIDVNAVAPGALNTRLLDEVLAAGPKQVGDAFYERALKQKDEGGVPLEKGAELCSFLLSAASDGISGRLISAVWDPWEKLPELRAKLHQSDIYTLRRIVPADRGLDWD